MTTATSMTRNIQIDNMTGDPCVQKVTGALKGVNGVTTQSVKVGHARIEADQSACDAACAAIGKVGYPGREMTGGDQSGAAKSSRPGMAGGNDDTARENDGDQHNKTGSATKMDHDANSGGKPGTDHDSKTGGSLGRIPMPNPTPAVAKAGGSGTDGRPRN